MGHRLRRIALPLAVGMVTIVPLVDWVSERAVDRTASAAVEQGDLRGAVFAGKAGAVAELLDRGIDPTDRPEWDPRGWTPLHAAVSANNVEIIELLLDRGADPAARTVELGDGGEVVNTYTALDLAVWYGRAEAADALVAGGAADIRPPGQDWSDLWWWRAGAAEVEEEDEDDDFALSTWLSSFHHLWFLWFLCWMVAGFAAVIGMVRLVALAHLPLVIEFQALIRDWDLPATVKFTGLCLAVTALLLAAYQIGVRHTPIGWLLNGHRRRSSAVD